MSRSPGPCGLPWQPVPSVRPYVPVTRTLWVAMAAGSFCQTVCPGHQGPVGCHGSRFLQSDPMSRSPGPCGLPWQPVTSVRLYVPVTRTLWVAMPASHFSQTVCPGHQDPVGCHGSRLLQPDRRPMSRSPGPCGLSWQPVTSAKPYAPVTGTLWLLWRLVSSSCPDLPLIFSTTSDMLPLELTAPFDLPFLKVVPIVLERLSLSDLLRMPSIIQRPSFYRACATYSYDKSDVSLLRLYTNPTLIVFMRDLLHK